MLLLGQQDAWTRLTWQCHEGVVPFPTGRGWVEIGSSYETIAEPPTLDGFFEACLKRATAGWVTAELEEARLIEIDRRPPARVRLIPWPETDSGR